MAGFHRIVPGNPQRSTHPGRRQSIIPAADTRIVAELIERRAWLLADPSPDPADDRGGQAP